MTKQETLEYIKTLPCLYYAEGTYAYYDKKYDNWYNDFGQSLRDPSYYDRSYDDWTPAGDE
jgi:hypothetical protein